MKWAKLFDNAEVIVLLYYGYERKQTFSQPFANRILQHLRSPNQMQFRGNFNICQLSERLKLMEVKDFRIPNQNICINAM